MPISNVQTPSTFVPNALIDQLLPQLSDSELRLLLVVVRQTQGWEDLAAPGGRKERDWLTQSQLVRRTGRSSKPVSAAIAGLVAKGLVQVLTDGGELLVTPEARRRHPGRHWFRLAPAWAQGGAEITGHHAESQESGHACRTDADKADGGKSENRGYGYGEPPRPRAEAIPIKEEADCPQGEGVQLPPVPDPPNRLSPARNIPACGGPAVENIHTTKETPNKRNSFSGRKTLKGFLPEKALSEEALLVGETAPPAPRGVELPQGESPYAQSTPTNSTERAGPAEERGTDAGGGMDAGLAEPGFLRRLAQGGAVDYDEVRRFLLNYQDACRKVFPERELPPLFLRREGWLVARLLEQHPYERLIRLLNLFFNRSSGTQGQADPWNYSLAAFAQTLPALLAQGQQQTRGGKAVSAALPIRLWREKDLLTVHGVSVSMVQQEGAQPAGAADDPAKRWHWDKRSGRWIENNNDEEGV